MIEPEDNDSFRARQSSPQRGHAVVLPGKPALFAECAVTKDNEVKVGILGTDTDIAKMLMTVATERSGASCMPTPFQPQQRGHSSNVSICACTITTPPQKAATVPSLTYFSDKKLAKASAKKHVNEHDGRNLRYIVVLGPDHRNHVAPNHVHCHRRSAASRRRLVELELITLLMIAWWPNACPSFHRQRRAPEDSASRNSPSKFSSLQLNASMTHGAHEMRPSQAVTQALRIPDQSQGEACHAARPAGWANRRWSASACRCVLASMIDLRRASSTPSTCAASLLSTKKKSARKKSARPTGISSRPPKATASCSMKSTAVRLFRLRLNARLRAA